MILQALYDYAQRKGDELPEDGFEDVEIKYLIKIREDGSLVDLISTIEDKKGHVYSKLPLHISRTSGIKANLLYDNVDYIARDAKKISAFLSEIEKLSQEAKSTREIRAVLAFYKENCSNGLDKIKSCDLWADCQKLKSTDYLSFQLFGEDNIIPQIDAVQQYQREAINAKTTGKISDSENESETGICLITGEKSSICRTHAPTSIIGGSNPTLVSFNNPAFESYGKKQALNAPVSENAKLAYLKALNYLVDSKDNNFILGGNPKDQEKKKDCNTIVFWAEKNDGINFENGFMKIFSLGVKKEDNPDENVSELKNYIKSIYTGKFEKIESNFYILCLYPNKGRISVRFWETGKVETFAKRIKQHFDDFEIIKPAFDEKEYLNLYQILSSTSLEHKMENVAPNLIGSVMQSILKGLPYPATLQQQCIRRIRAEKDFKDEHGKWHYKVSRERAAILKAYINRLNRQKNIKEVSVALDRTNTNKGYLLGRLFAVFEKVQQESADTELNSTITDRFYGAASTNPVTVFTQLMRLNRNHMSKLQAKNRGLHINRDKEIGEIMNAIDSFPAHLDLNEQSYFAIGYYHEKQSFFDKQNKSEELRGEE